MNSTTNVGITLKRTVAKVVFQTTIDPSFADKYAGTLTINSVKTLQSRLAVARRGRNADTQGHDLQPRRRPPWLRENTMRCSTVSRMELCPRAAAFC